LLRAIGLSRGQAVEMIAVESVLISVFGALLGVAVGVLLGVAIGVVASVAPAVRAARPNVLAAIAYE
jgi:putative ABC transport system permease protein